MDVEFLTPALRVRDGPCDEHAGNTPTKQKRRWGVCVGIRHVQLLHMAASALVTGSVRAMTPAALSALIEHDRRSQTPAGHTMHGYTSIVHAALMTFHLLGHALAALPAAALPERGSRWVRPTPLLVVSLSGSAAIAIAMPHLVLGEWWACSALVMMMGGMLQTLPGAALRMLIDRWMPSREARVASDAIFICMGMGGAVGWACSGRVLSLWWLHWRGVWYAAGGGALVMAVCVAALTADGPDSHPAAGPDERDYIRDTQPQPRGMPRAHWGSLVTSRALWGALCARAASMALYGILSSCGVSYLQRAGYALEHSMYIMSVGAVCHVVVGAVYGRCVRMYGMYGDSVSHHRRQKTYYTMLNNGIGCVLSVSLLTALSQSPPLQGVRAAVVVVGLMAVHGIQQHNELEYLRESFGVEAGRVLSLSMSVSGTVTAAAPIAAAMLLGDHMSFPVGWRCVFLPLGALQVVSSVTINVLGTRNKHTNTQYTDSGIVYLPCSTHAETNIMLPLDEDDDNTKADGNKQIFNNKEQH